MIRRGRLERGWSQEGLCRGLCSVSWLSKIESGAAEADGELLGALLGRLGLSPEAGEGEAQLIERAYEAFFGLDTGAGRECLAALEEALPELERGPLAVDAQLLRSALADRDFSGDWPEDVLSGRQRALLLMLRGRFAEAWRVSGEALALFLAGDADFFRGNYTAAMGELNAAFGAAAEQGRVRVMLLSRLVMGNCCSNSGQYEAMEGHYAVAERIALALGDASALRSIRYNRASTAIELGRAREGYGYFSTLEEPGAMELHKLAAACELLGLTDEALSALDRVPGAPPPDSEEERELLGEMCAVMRYRLEHPEYLGCAEYGERLLSLFSELRRRLPPGYAGFHLRRVLEWLRANRQYKRALEILSDFPGHYS